MYFYFLIYDLLFSLQSFPKYARGMQSIAFFLSIRATNISITCIWLYQVS